MPNSDQDDFLADLRDGNPRSFNVLYEHYGTPLFNLAYRLTGSVTESEDILQETFIKVYESIDQFNGNSKLFTWIYSICQNLCFRHLQNIKRLTFDGIEGLIVESSGWDYRKDKYSEEEWGHYTNQVREGCLFALVRCLPFSQRVAFVLHILLNLPLSSVATVLGKTNGATRVLISRGRQKIKNFLCAHCSLFKESNRCTCMNFVDYSLRKGLIDTSYRQSRYKKASIPLEVIQKDVSDLKKMLGLYDNLPDAILPPDTLAAILEVMKNGTIAILAQ